jgi:hypothetical protein
MTYNRIDRKIKILYLKPVIVCPLFKHISILKVDYKLLKDAKNQFKYHFICVIKIEILNMTTKLKICFAVFMLIVGIAAITIPIVQFSK